MHALECDVTDSKHIMRWEVPIIHSVLAAPFNLRLPAVRGQTVEEQHAPSLQLWRAEAWALIFVFAMIADIYKFLFIECIFLSI